MDNRKKQKIIQLLPLWLYKVIKKVKADNDISTQILYNIGKDCSSRYRVLLSYIPQYLFVEDLNDVIGTKEKECASFVHALIVNGCTIDICSVNYRGEIKNDYDYIIGQGNAFRRAKSINPQARTILYLTEKTPSFSLKKERERVDYLAKRHGIKAKIRRSGKYFIEEDFEKLDYCIMMGKKEDEHLVPNSKTFIIHPSGLKNETFRIEDRDIEKAKRNFIWIGSSGAVHKGLDILFDVFRNHPELTLHVVGLNPIDRSLLKSLMPKNIIDYGYMLISSDEFRQIANKCAFIVFPSCSEAAATSVVTAMNHGMIPLVSDESSFEKNNCGEKMMSYQVEDVDEVVKRWSEKNNELLIKEMHKTIAFAEAEYSIEHYSKSIHNIVSQILNEQK